ncbi:hypothetical protein PR003_g27997, partial [Phytophthora rubi]
NGACTCPSTSTFVNGACVCSGGQALVSNVCTCPSTSTLTGTGESAVCRCSGSFGFIDGVCSTCPSGSSVVDGECACSGDREIVDGACACAGDQDFTNGKCVPKCFWTHNNVGYECFWTDPSKASLALNNDCEISSPSALDNYVADKRTNKYDEILGDPVISLTATNQDGSAGVTQKATWREYLLTPTTLENKVTFDTFGVFDLEMTATDYSGVATCSGCVAIVDKYPPTAETKCQTTEANTLSTAASYADGKLAEAITQESRFAAFYSDDNVKNNGGANDRCDDVTAEMQDFFASSASTLASVDNRCFDDDFVTQLLDKTSGGTNLLASATQSELDGLQCTRCCSKSLTLKEYYYDYKCGTDLADAEKKVATSDQCSFNYCLNMPSDALVDAGAVVTESVAEETTKVLGGLPTSVAPALNVIHRSITCTAVNKGCSYTPVLGDLFTHKSSWGAAGLEEYDVKDYVFWRYAVDTEDWHPWSDSAALTFTNTQTTVYVEAWTRCGRAYRDTFTVVLHPHSPHNACTAFRQMWAENSPTPLTNDNSHMCAYPGSDFVMMTFAYDSEADSIHDADTVKVKYTDVKCYVTLAEGGPGNLAKVTEAELPLTWPSTASGRIQISKQLALELVHDPTTAETTDVNVQCDFTFKYFGSEETDNEPCAYPFTIKDCDAPELETTSPAVCELGSPTGVPGPFEACSGNIFTTVNGASQLLTERKPVNDECCESSTALSCVSLTESASDSGVKRCEPSTHGPLPGQMMAMELRVDDEDVGETKLATSASPSAVELLAATALVAIVALFVVKQRVTAAERLARETDDVYVTLLD